MLEIRLVEAITKARGQTAGTSGRLAVNVSCIMKPARDGVSTHMTRNNRLRLDAVDRWAHQQQPAEQGPANPATRLRPVSMAVSPRAA